MIGSEGGRDDRKELMEKGVMIGRKGYREGGMIERKVLREGWEGRKDDREHRREG